MDPLLQGLQLSLLGMATTFGALGLFILIIVLLQATFGERRRHADTSASVSSSTADGPIQATDSPEAHLAAAIAVAIELERQPASGPGGLGASLRRGPGRWWSSQFEAESPPAPEIDRGGSS
jgi:Na+-transporting methylmalonyl-CoA/oxaloacetate decarboxylase gamma subunit